tara:strand:+ start:6232 stop:6648 length:417 start_codon:yes stop_codon:yes gene_type:complete
MADLVIAGIGMPPAAIRGVTQTLEPISASMNMARTVNGSMIDLSAPEFRKYSSKIQCADQIPPALSGVWPGAVVTVDCIADLSFLTATGSAERPIVESWIEGDYTIYRPRLSMMVVAFDLSKDEWQASTGWSLELEEI